MESLLFHFSFARSSVFRPLFFCRKESGQKRNRPHSIRSAQIFARSLKIQVVPSETRPNFTLTPLNLYASRISAELFIFY